MYNLDEVFEIAEQIERNGARFYRKAAEFFQGTNEGNMLSELAAWEDEHEITFQNLRKELVTETTGAESFDPDGEVVAYLQAIADGEVFNIREDPSDTLTGNEKITEIIHIALGRERDSIAYFLGVKKLMSQGAGEEHVEKIIQEEMGHIRILNDRLAELKNH